jgi:hypothetical protein
MSQRECAGFNWPPLSIPAVEPVSISPVAVSRAGCGLLRNISAIVATVAPRPCPFQLLPFSAISSKFVCGLSLALGVGQPVSHAVRPSSAFVGTLSHCEPSFQSRVVGIAQPANVTASCKFT